MGAGQTVDLLYLYSGGSTPSPTTNFMSKKEINERRAALIAEKLQDGTFWDNYRKMWLKPLCRPFFSDYILENLLDITPLGCIRVWDHKELESWLSPA